MRNATLLTLLLSFAPSVLFAGHFGDFHVIPGAGNVPGVAGSRWQTDVVIHNFQTTPLTVEMGLVESGPGPADNFFPVLVDGAATFTVAPGATRNLANVLHEHRGHATAMGALLIGGDQPFAVTSRIYNVDASGVAVGQTVPAAQDFLSTTSQVAVIPGLTANANVRSNIGFVAAAGAAAPLVLELALTGATGARLGATTFTIAPGAISHIQLSTLSLTTIPFDLATATIRILSGSGDVTGYASLIDNRTNHAMFVSSGVPGSASNPTESTFAERLRQIR